MNDPNAQPRHRGRPRVEESEETLQRILRVKAFREMGFAVQMIAAIEKVHPNTIRNDLAFLKKGQKVHDKVDEEDL